MPNNDTLRDALHLVETENVTWIGDRFPVFWKSGQGSWIEDVDGRRFLDMSASFGVMALGHAHPAVTRAIQDQSERLVHGMGDVHPPEIKWRLLERLGHLLPLQNPRITLGTSGTMATEIALKTAFAHTKRTNVLFFEGAYHGLTSGALRVCGHKKFWQPFASTLGPRTEPLQFPVGCIDPDEDSRRLRASLTEVRSRLEVSGHDIGAIIVEPIQGRGGVRVPPEGFLSGLRTLCDDFDVVLIFDEIFTGMYRTGARFCCNKEGVEPDIILLGKALGGGLPIGVCAGRESVMNAFGPSRGEAVHTETFLGNPLTMAAANAVLDTLEDEGVQDQMRLRADHLSRIMHQLSAALGPRSAGVIGRGLMLGIPILDPDSGAPDPGVTGQMMKSALDHGVIVLGGGVDGNVLQCTPPLLITAEDLDAFASSTQVALSPWTA